MTIELADGTKLRRDFKLPEEDVDCLDALRLKWETTNEGGSKWLIIHGHSIPFLNGRDFKLAMSCLKPDEGIGGCHEDWRLRTNQKKNANIFPYGISR